jgi:hypothetical protein
VSKASGGAALGWAEAPAGFGDEDGDAWSAMAAVEMTSSEAVTMTAIAPDMVRDELRIRRPSEGRGAR